MCVCGGGGGGGGLRVGGGDKLVLLAGNLALNSDAASKYKYMFGSHRDPLQGHDELDHRH